jgi:hypothetical protein
MKKLPIGIQSFSDLRGNDYLYVDKTEDIYRLIASGKIYFLSRPRRFGKSLLISTMEELFKGTQDLFEGLYVYDKWDWTQQYPVIRIDWTNIMHGTKKEIEQDMSDFLKRKARFYGMTLISEYAASLFSELIELLHRKTGQKVVVLIDEYDSPILDTMGQPEAGGIRDFLQGFYKRLKANDDHLKFIFLTGVTKVAKVSIFSVLNSPDDISIDDKYASICGYTQAELERDFSEHIDDTAIHLDMTRDGLLKKIRKMYDGYTWDGKTPVYNPYSTLSFFSKQKFSNYWFETGTPTFLINRLKKHNLAKTVLDPVIVDSSAFNSYDPDALDDVPLLFQTGYLTVKDENMTNGDSLYTLGVPNLEVRDSLMKHLLNAYTQYPIEQLGTIGRAMLQQIRNLDEEGLTRNLQKMLAGVPYNLQPEDSMVEDANEARYHIIFQVWMTLLGFNIQSEKPTNRGRMDAVLLQPGLAIVAELKYIKNTDAKNAKTRHAASLQKATITAIAQIREKRYYEQFLDRKIILLGIAFSGKELGCRIEPL